MTDEVIATFTEWGICTKGTLSIEEAEQLLQVLPALIVEAKGAYRKRLQENIIKAEQRVGELRKELESLQ